MHAASVHPEPGSNSRANCIQTAVAVKILFVELVWLFILCWVCPESVIDSRFFFQRNFEILHKLCLYFNLLLFNCQWSARFSPPFQCRVLHSLTIISQPFAFVKGFFKTFLSFFDFFQAASLDSLQSGCEAHYITFGSLCQVPFQKFFQLFFVISCALSSLRLPARWQLAYYSTSIPFCQ